MRLNSYPTNPSSSPPGGAEANTSAAQDKCKIVSASAVKRVVGGSLVAETSGLSGVGNLTCMFEFTKTASGPGARILLSANQSGKRSTFRSTKKRTPGALTISGLGDDAFFVKATSTLQFRKGAEVVIIQDTVRRAGATGAVAATGRPVLVRLARAVLAQ